MRYLPLVFAIGCTMPDLDPVDPSETVAVEAVAVCPSGQWCIEIPPVAAQTVLLHSAFALSAEDVLAVGDGGTILRRNSDVWTAMASGTTNNLRGVWAASASDMWAAGVGATVLHFDGSAWTQLSVPTTVDIDAVWGSSPTDVWFCGGGTVLRWNGTTFSVVGSFGGVLLTISGTGPNDVWTTGENTNMHHWNGTSWTVLNPVSGVTTYFAVLARSSTEVWTTDFSPGKESARWNGVKWTSFRTNSGTGAGVFNGLGALASNDIWGAGGTRVGRWNGTAWTTDAAPFGSGVSLWSVAAVPGNVWVVGAPGLIAHRSL